MSDSECRIVSDAELDDLYAKARAATPGPFTIPEGYQIYAVEKHFASAFESYSYNKDEVIDTEQAKANAAFIAAADPSLIIALIDSLRHARAERDLLVNKIRGLNKFLA